MSLENTGVPEPLPPNPPGKQYPRPEGSGQIRGLLKGAKNALIQFAHLPESQSTFHSMEQQATVAFLGGTLSSESVMGIGTRGIGRFIAREPILEMMKLIPSDSGIRTAVGERISQIREEFGKRPEEERKTISGIIESEKNTFIQAKRPDFAETLDLIKKFVDGKLEGEDNEIFKGLVLSYPLVKKMNEVLDPKSTTTTAHTLLLPFLGSKDNGFIGAQMIASFSVIMGNLMQPPKTSTVVSSPA